MIEKLLEYFSYPFVQYAMIVGVLISLCSSLFGTTLVLKRFSFIGDGLSHVAFGAAAVATVCGLTNEMYVVLPVTVVCAVILLCSGEKAKIKGDAAVAMISVGALAIGYLVMNVFPSASGNVAGDVCTTLFGSTLILTLSDAEVAICIALSALVVAAFVLLYHRIFAITFDENFASAIGVNAKLFNFVLAVIIAVVIVLAMNLVGSLLISALIIFPALSAMRVFKSYKKVIICSAITSVGCTALGIMISVLASTPVGSTVVAVDIVVFAVYYVVGIVLQKHKKVCSADTRQTTSEA